jgi:hypothetical protein
MTKVEALEQEISKLTAEELAELRDWLLALDDQQWDEQIEVDAASGKLDLFFEKAVADHVAGKSRKL